MTRRPVLFTLMILSLSGCWNDPQSQTAASSYAITTLLLDPGRCSTDVSTGRVDCSVLYAATAGNGVFKSEDGGTSWSRRVDGLYEWNITVLAMDPKDPMTLYAGTENSGLFKTTDGGANWFNPSTSAGTIRSITAITVDPYATCLPSPCIYVGSEESGVWVSDDNGLSWAQMNDGLPPGEGTIVTALVVFSYSGSPSVLYAGTEGGHLYKFNRTVNNGTWEEALPGLSEKTTASPLVIAVNPITPSELYVGTSGGESESTGGTFRSVNAGQTWTVMPIPNAQNFSVRVLTFCLQVEPRCPPTVPDTADLPENDDLRESNILYAGVYGLSITSLPVLPGGLWTNLFSATSDVMIGNNVSSLAIDTQRHTTLYAGTLLGFVIKSQDAGATWERIDIDL